MDRISPPFVNLHVIDVALLFDQDYPAAGVYLACSPASRQSGPVGAAAIYWSQDDVAYDYLLTIPLAATSGALITDLDFDVTSGLDSVEECDVQITHGSLVSITDDERDSQRKNVAVIGDEVLAFKTATPIQTDQYTIGGGILRGLYGTTANVVLHPAETRFVVIKRHEIAFVPLPPERVGTSIFFKAVYPGQDLDDVEAIEITFAAPWWERAIVPSDIAGDGLLTKAVAGALAGIKMNLTATSDPTVNDDSGDGYDELSPWVNVTSNKIFWCADPALGAAVWKEVGATASIPPGSITPTELAANSVTTPKILDANVTLAKLSDLVTDSLLGRFTAGTGVPERIAVSDDAQVVITAANFAAIRAALTLVIGTNIQAYDSDLDAIAANITADGYALISAANYAAMRTLLGLGALALKNTIAAGDIDADAVTTAKILNANVTLAKMVNIGANKIWGRADVGAGVASELDFKLPIQQMADDASFTVMRQTMGLELGVDIQAYSAILADIAAGNGFQTIRKTSDESRNTTTTLADDSTLKKVLAASTKYILRITAYYKIANAAMDFKYGIAYSGTTSGDIIVYHGAVAAGSSPGTGTEVTGTQNSLIASQQLLSSVAGIGRLYFEVIITTNATGTFSFQWAQNTSDGANASVLLGSTLEWALAA